MIRIKPLCLLVAASLGVSVVHAASPTLAAIGSLSSSGAGSFADLSGLGYTLENGVAANLLGGMGSGLAWAGGDTFLALPDRGPNAVAWNSALSDTASYIDRFQTVTLTLAPNAPGGLPYMLTPTLTKTTLLYSTSALNYGSAGVSAGGAAYQAGSWINGNSGVNYFTGRADNFGSGNSLNANNARLDPEGIRVSNDGKSVFISDEYGPYVYQFNRLTGERTRTFSLPDNLAVKTLSASGDAEIAGNTSGRVANKGMEGLAITPDGKTLVGFVQSPLIQDSTPGKSAGTGTINRIVTIDIASGATKQFAYNNVINGKSYNSSEILALNDTQFLVLERDGKGLGDGSAASVKQIWAVDLAGAADISNLSGEAAIAAKAPGKTLFLDIAAALKSFGIADTNIPAKIEGMAFGKDIVENGVTKHTLYVANDNDFLQGAAGTNQFYVFTFTDTDLASKGLKALQSQSISPVPEPDSAAMLLAGLGLMGAIARRRRVQAAAAGR